MLQIVHQGISLIAKSDRICYDEAMIRRINNPKRKQKTYDSPMDAAMHYLGGNARTVREVERFLSGCEFDPQQIQATAARLKELGLLDDGAYCREFVESRLRAKPVSRRRLMEQLMAHEADRDAAEAALSAVEDETEMHSARAVAEKYMRQFAALEEPRRTQRVRARLAARGFDSELIREVTNRDDDTWDGD